MKATGEVMSICTSFEGALMKAVRSLEQHADSLMSCDFTGLDDAQLQKQLRIDDQRIWAIAEALRRGFTYEGIHKATQIDLWFIDKIAVLVEMEEKLRTEPLTRELLAEAKRIEFPDEVIAGLTGRSADQIRAMRLEYGITASFKMVDTCAAEFEAQTPYYYSVFGGENEADAGICGTDPQQAPRPCPAGEGKKKPKVFSAGIRSDPDRAGDRVRFLFSPLYLGISEGGL